MQTRVSEALSIEGAEATRELALYSIGERRNSMRACLGRSRQRGRGVIGSAQGKAPRRKAERWVRGQRRPRATLQTTRMTHSDQDQDQRACDSAGPRLVGLLAVKAKRCPLVPNLGQLLSHLIGRIGLTKDQSIHVGSERNQIVNLRVG